MSEYNTPGKTSSRPGTAGGASKKGSVGARQEPEAFRRHWRTKGLAENDGPYIGLSIGMVAERLDGVQLAAGSGLSFADEGDLRSLCWIALLPLGFDEAGKIESRKVPLAAQGFLWEAMDELDARWPLSGFASTGWDAGSIATGSGLKAVAIPGAGLARLLKEKTATPGETAAVLNESRRIMAEAAEEAEEEAEAEEAEAEEIDLHPYRTDVGMAGACMVCGWPEDVRWHL